MTHIETASEAQRPVRLATFNRKSIVPSLEYRRRWEPKKRVRSIQACILGELREKQDSAIRKKQVLGHTGTTIPMTPAMSAAAPATFSRPLRSGETGGRFDNSESVVQ
jgi:hypothetical protein